MINNPSSGREKRKVVRRACFILELEIYKVTLRRGISKEEDKQNKDVEYWPSDVYGFFGKHLTHSLESLEQVDPFHDSDGNKGNQHLLFSKSELEYARLEFYH